MLFDYDFLSLNLCFFKWFGWFDFEGFQEERMELCECEFGAENTSIEEKVDDLTVLKNVGLGFGEGGDEVTNFILIVFG